MNQILERKLDQINQLVNNLQQKILQNDDNYLIHIRWIRKYYKPTAFSSCLKANVELSTSHSEDVNSLQHEIKLRATIEASHKIVAYYSSISIHNSLNQKSTIWLVSKTM